MACPHSYEQYFKIKSDQQLNSSQESPLSKTPLRISPGLYMNLCECSWGGAEDDIISVDKWWLVSCFHVTKPSEEGKVQIHWISHYSNLDPKLFHTTTHPKSLVLLTCDLSCSILAFGLHGSEPWGGRALSLRWFSNVTPGHQGGGDSSCCVHVTDQLRGDKGVTVSERGEWARHLWLEEDHLVEPVQLGLWVPLLGPVCDSEPAAVLWCGGQSPRWSLTSPPMLTSSGLDSPAEWNEWYICQQRTSVIIWTQKTFKKNCYLWLQGCSLVMRWDWWPLVNGKVNTWFSFEDLEEEL